MRRWQVYRGTIHIALMIAALAAVPGHAQNLITQDSWEGFALRDTDNKFDHCVLYNRSVQALSVSPYQMLGITRDAAGRIGLLIFYEPRTLSRGATTVRLKLDQRAAVAVPGEAVSDFHVQVPALDSATLAALRDAKTIEAAVDTHTIRFELTNVGAVLDRLDVCVKIYGPKS